MTSADDIRVAIQLAKERFGPITAAVNCAGIGVAVKTLNKKGQPHSIEDFNKTLQVFTIFVVKVRMKLRVGNGAREKAPRKE